MKMKILYIFILSIIIFISLYFSPLTTTISLAIEPKGTDASGGGTSVSTRIDTSGIGVDEGATTEFDDVGEVILGIVQGVGIGVSVIALVVMGIIYMIGSVEEKAEYKSRLIPYIIGIAFLVGATAIPNFIYKLVN